MLINFLDVMQKVRDKGVEGMIYKIGIDRLRNSVVIENEYGESVGSLRVNRGAEQVVEDLIDLLADLDIESERGEDTW